MESKHGMIWLCSVCLLCVWSFSEVDGTGVERRNAVPPREPQEYSDYPLLGVRYDEYPMIVPKKRAALLLDRLMVALQKAIEEEEEQENAMAAGPARSTFRPEDVRSMDLQRRGHQGSLAGQQKGRVYWRCYFNAVTCFK